MNPNDRKQCGLGQDWMEIIIGDKSPYLRQRVPKIPPWS